MWKGSLQLGEHEVPLKLYAAAERGGTSLRLLDPKTGRPVHQRMIDPRTGDEVAEVHRGFEVERGTFVLLSDEELAEIEPAKSSEIEVLAFVPTDAIDLARYHRPYWLGPDGEPEAYAALARALTKTDRIAVVKWVMRKRRYVGALRAEDGYLALSTLRHADEVVAPTAIDAPKAKVDAKEAKLAAQLVDALADDFDLSEYRETYRDRLAEVLKKKARGETIERLPKSEAPAAPDDLEEVLRRSLEAAKKTSKKSTKREKADA